MDGPGRRTSDPVPKDTTGNGDAAVERRRWASIDRFWFDAHTVQNLSLYESDDVVAADDSAGWDSEWAVISELASGGGGGGGGGVAVPVCASRGSWAIVLDSASFAFTERRVLSKGGVAREAVIREVGKCVH